jgi:hypothetical protein
MSAVIECDLFLTLMTEFSDMRAQTPHPRHVVALAARVSTRVAVASTKIRVGLDFSGVMRRCGSKCGERDRKQRSSESAAPSRNTCRLWTLHYLDPMLDWHAGAGRNS